MARSSKKTNSTLQRKKTKKVPRNFKLTINSEELPINTKVKVLNYLKNMNKHVQKISYDDLLSFAKENSEFLSMKLNGKPLKNLLKKTNEKQFKKFQEFMDSLKTVSRKSLSGGSSRTLALRSNSRNNSPKENNQIIGYIKSVNVFLENPEVRKLAIYISILVPFLAFVYMLTRGLLRSNKAIELPDLSENAIVTLGVTGIIGTVIVVVVRNVTSTTKDTIIRKQEIEYQMQTQALQADVVNKSQVSVQGSGLGALALFGNQSLGGPYNRRHMPLMQVQMGMPMMQGQMGMPYNNRRMPIGY